jgi:hypothetical protein
VTAAQQVLLLSAVPLLVHALCVGALQVQAAMLINSDLPGVTLQQQQGAPQRPMRCAPTQPSAADAS